MSTDDDDQIVVEFMRHGFGWNQERARQAWQIYMPEINEAGTTVQYWRKKKFSIHWSLAEAHIIIHRTMPVLNINVKAEQQQHSNRQKVNRSA